MLYLYITANREDYLVGAASPFTNKKWIYDDNTLVKTPASNWANGFPRNNNNKQNCMYLKKPNDYQQRNDNCDSNYAYICAYDPFM